MSNLSSTADDILACARSLIIEGGYNGFSYADIADVVGIRRASIHHHFPSKVDLVRTLVLQYREDARAGFAELERTAADPRAQLANYVGYWESCIRDESAPFCVCALLAGELPVLPAEVASEVRLHFETLARWLASALERGAESGVFRLTTSPEAEAQAFMAGVHGGMLSARVQGNPHVFSVVTAALIEHLSP